MKQYIPIDISEAFLIETAQQLKHDFASINPNLTISPLVADFTKPMNPLTLDQDLQRMIFFPGSTIGNFAPDDAKSLLNSFHTLVGDNAWLLIGVDMTQDEAKLLAAYDDKAGITADFNCNILVRANRELASNFDVKQFKHQALLNKVDGRIEMHLLSLKSQQVNVDGKPFLFTEGETIHTENCYKYSLNAFTALALECGWKLEHLWQDKEESNFGVLLLKS